MKNINRYICIKMRNIKDNITYEFFNTVWLGNDPALYMIIDISRCELEFNYIKNV